MKFYRPHGCQNPLKQEFQIRNTYKLCSYITINIQIKCVQNARLNAETGGAYSKHRTLMD
jgi:hypothetical protein